MAVVAQLRHARPHLLHVRHQVAVSEHRALGQPSGAAGVLQHGDVVQGHRMARHSKARAHAQGALERNRPRQVVGRDHLLDFVDHGVDQPAFGGGHEIAHPGFDQVVDLRVGAHLLHT